MKYIFKCRDYNFAVAKTTKKMVCHFRIPTVLLTRAMVLKSLKDTTIKGKYCDFSVHIMRKHLLIVTAIQPQHEANSIPSLITYS